MNKLNDRFHQNGKLKERIVVKQDNRIEVNKYDILGNNIEKLYFDNDGNEYQKEVMSFHSNGKKFERSQYMQGKLWRKFEYNTNGRKVLDISYNVDRSIRVLTFVSYDLINDTKKKVDYDLKGSFLSENEYPND